MTEYIFTETKFDEKYKTEPPSSTPLERYMKKFNNPQESTDTLKILTTFEEIYSALTDLQDYDGEISIPSHFNPYYSYSPYLHRESKIIVTWDICKNNLLHIKEFYSEKILGSLVLQGPYGIIAFYFVVNEIVSMLNEDTAREFPPIDFIFATMTSEMMKVMIDNGLLFLLQYVLRKLGKETHAQTMLGDAIDIDTICDVKINYDLYEFFVFVDENVVSVDYVELFKIIVLFKSSIPDCFCSRDYVDDWLSLLERGSLDIDKIRKILLDILAPLITPTNIDHIKRLMNILILQKEYLGDQFYHDLVLSDIGTVLCFLLFFCGGIRLSDHDILFGRIYVLIQYYLIKLAIFTFISLGYDENETSLFLRQGVKQLEKKYRDEDDTVVDVVEAYLKRDDADMSDEIMPTIEIEQPPISDTKFKEVIEKTIEDIESESSLDSTPVKKSQSSHQQEAQTQESEMSRPKHHRRTTVECNALVHKTKSMNAFYYDKNQKKYFMKLGSVYTRMDCPSFTDDTLTLRYSSTSYTYSSIKPLPSNLSQRENQFIYLENEGWVVYDKSIHQWVNGRWTKVSKSRGGKGKTKKASRFRAHKYISEKHASFQKSIYQRSIRHIPKKSFRH